MTENMYDKIAYMAENGTFPTVTLPSIPIPAMVVAQLLQGAAKYVEIGLAEKQARLDKTQAETAALLRENEANHTDSSDSTNATEANHTGGGFTIAECSFF